MRIPQWLGQKTWENTRSPSAFQNRFSTISKSYQNHKHPREIDQKPVPGLFLFPFLKPTHQNHNKIKSKLSKLYQHRINTISKSYQNHKNPREIDQTPVPGLFQFPFLKPTHREP
jgi:hypothetical protein